MAPETVPRSSRSTLPPVPNRVCDIREALGLSKAEMCRRANTSMRELKLIENGHVPKLATARRIVHALGAASVDLVFPDPDKEGSA